MNHQSLKILTTQPDLGLGSNQVDFGGIIKPASAILNTSVIFTGCIAKAIWQSVLHLIYCRKKNINWNC